MFFAFLKGRIPFSGLQTFFPDGKLQNEYTKKVFGFQAVRFRPQKNHQNQIFEGAVFGTPFRGLECIFRGGPKPPGAGLPSGCLTRCDRGASCVRLPSACSCPPSADEEKENIKADSTLRSSRAVPHPSTNRALRRLTSEVERDPVHSTRYGRQRHLAAGAVPCALRESCTHLGG